MSEIEAIYSQLEDVLPEIPHSVRKELEKAPKWIQSKIRSTIYTIEYRLTEEERKTLREIHSILFPNQTGLRQNEGNDVVHVLKHKNTAAIILSHWIEGIFCQKSELAKRFNLNVITPSECLNVILTVLKSERGKC